MDVMVSIISLLFRHGIKRSYFFNSSRRLARNAEEPDRIFLPSRFFDDLERRGPEAVLELTSNIDIFSKEMVFIPIPKDSHWSLLVLIQPGVVKHSASAGMVFLDSIKNYASKENICREILQWLNFEWRHRGIDNSTRNTFKRKNFPLILPDGTS